MDKASWERLGGNQGILALCNSLEMIHEIPKVLSERAFDSSIVENALIDSWYINMRSLIEYFHLKKDLNKNKDYSAKDFAWEFEAQDYSEWENIWILASKWVGHVSRDRGLYEWVESDEKYSDFKFMKSINLKMLHIASNFCEYLRRIESPSYDVLKNTLQKFKL